MLSGCPSEDQGLPSWNINKKLLNLNSLFCLPELACVRKQMEDFIKLEQCLLIFPHLTHIPCW